MVNLQRGERASLEHPRTPEVASDQAPLSTIDFSCPSSVQNESIRPELKPAESNTPVIQSTERYQESLELLKREYLLAGLTTDGTNLQNPLEYAESTVTMASYNRNGSLFSRASLVLYGRSEWSETLPCMAEPTFKKFITKRLKGNKGAAGTVGEVTRLARDSKQMTNKMNSLADARKIKALMDSISLMSIGLELRYLYLVCHPHHVQFYLDNYNADAPCSVDSYAGANNHPGVLVEIDVEDFHCFTEWAPRVINRQVAGPIGAELRKMKELYDGRIQATRSDLHNHQKH